MKKTLTLLTVLVIVITSAFKIANTCESFFPQKTGTKWEISNYDKKNKVVGKGKYELLSLTDITGGLEAKVGIESFDSKDNSVMKGDMTMKCQDDKFYMDMSNMFPQQQMAGMEGMEMEMTNQYLEFPSNPVAGQTLSDAETTMTMKMNGMQIMSMTMLMTNRKIEGYSDVTTPAGTYNCVKYTCDSQMKSKMFNTTSHSVMYMSKNVGMVKVESYNDKNELESTSVLTSYSN